jgi:hypothetical protein
MFNRIIFDNEIQNFLLSVKNSNGSINRLISVLLYGSNPVIVEDGNFISKGVKSDTVSYLPKSKYSKMDPDPYADKIGRVSIKIGRFIKRFVSKDAMVEFNITDSTIETFVNLYKSYFTYDENKMIVVSGDDIKKYYLEDNYWSPSGKKSGSLWNSCMRQSERNKFLNIYSKNDCVKMLVYLSDDNKVRARALLWQDVKEHNSTESYKFMDRIYSYFDHDINFFKKWASENGYIYKAEQNAKSETLFEIDGEIVRKKLYVILENNNFSYFPYLDTFKYFNTFKNRFSNSDRFNYDYTLVQSDGSVERESEPEEEYYDIDFDDEY